MKSIIVSVIVPIYNAEKYLKECINSIVNQTLHDIEIILVDDGSSDDSIRICRSFAELDERIILLEQKNSGSSVARNNGIEHASGKYISFVDADDVICKDMLQQLVDKAETTSADIVICNHYRMHGSDLFPQNNHIVSDLILDTKQEINIFQYQMTIKGYKSDQPILFFAGAPWARIYRSSIINDNNIRFESKLRIMQDGLFNLYALEYSKKLVIIKEPLYCYRVLQNSNSNKTNVNIIKYVEEVFKEDEKFFYKYKSDDPKFHEVINVKKVVNVYKYLDKYFFTNNFLESHNFKYVICEISNLLNREPYFSALRDINYKLLTKSELLFVLAVKFRLYVLLYVMVKIRRRIIYALHK